jgi:uncharacterized protein
MVFEFDPTKSAANAVKHGIDFTEAQAIWVDPERLERPAQFASEPRVQVIGQIGSILWSAFVTIRHGSNIRIISVRRARDDERKDYSLNISPQDADT